MANAIPIKIAGVQTSSLNKMMRRSYKLFFLYACFCFIPPMFCGVFVFIPTLLCGVFLYWWTTSTFYSYSVNTISCNIITHHPIISPVLINILSLSGTLYVVWLLTSVSIEKYNMMLIQMLFIVRNWNIPEKKRNKSSKTL